MTVLIVEDEECILELTSLYLRNHGYTTMQCSTAQSALERFQQAGGAVDLVIADVSLPDGSGVETAVKLWELKPELKLLFISGRPLDCWQDRDADLIKQLPPDSVGFLQKPFPRSDLLKNALDLTGKLDAEAQPKEGRCHPEATHRSLMTALERQAELLELAHDAIIVRDLKGAIRFWNRGAETLYGWSRDHARGRLSHELLRTVFVIPFHEIQRALTETGHWEGELRQTIRDGSTIIVSSRWAVRDGMGGEAEVLEINRDITAQKRVEESFRCVNRELALRVDELRRAEARFRRLLESAPDAMVIVNGNGEIVLVNEQTEKVFGYARDELLGKNVDTLVPQRFRGRHHAHRSGYASTRHVRPMGEHQDLYGIRKNGEEFPVEISLSPLETEEGILISSSIRDISEGKKNERAFREKGLWLENAVKAKDLFLATMGHELRAPLHTVIGFADVLMEELKGPLNTAQKRYIGYILRDSRHLMELINNLLDLSKIQSGGSRLRSEVFGVGEAIGAVVNSVQLQIDAKSLRIERGISGELTVYADHLRFKQVLYNLLSNAIKFTPVGGSIGINAARRNGFVEIAVRDTGIGIPKDSRESVFERFQQVGSVRSRMSGTGLGLAIARALVEHHGGRIWLESERDQGSCFTFTMPAGERPGNGCVETVRAIGASC